VHGFDSAWKRALAAAITLFSVGCGAGGPATPSTTPPVDEPSATALAPRASASLAARPSADCIQARVIRDLTAMTVENMTATARVIAVGTFDGYRATRWNTPDASRPRSARDGAILERPMDITVTRLLRGEPAAFTNAVHGGGELGCDYIVYSDGRALEVGARYVVFLFPVSDSDGVLRGKHGLMDAWPILEGNIVRTCRDGNMPLTELIAAVSSRPYTGHLSGDIIYGSPCSEPL
jgi:hypothetical protein